MNRATFGAGCFWHVQEVFSNLKGVIKTTVGYSGGTLPDPTYKQVCSGQTGHAEVVEVEYDPSQITYEQLLDCFWSLHDPTTLNRKGPDIGSQYRSVIFYHSPDQKAAAEVSKEKLQQTKGRLKSIVTAIEPARSFYRAEEYHQCYLKKQS